MLGTAGLAIAAEPPSAARHVVVYAEEGRFAGWPANHGIWSWGDEILVGFSRGYYKDQGPFHHIDKEKPEEFLLARSRDGGATWSVEEPRPPGALVGTPGMRHGLMPPGVPREQPVDLHEPIDFDPPRLRDDRPHGEHERRSVALLLLVRPRPDLAGPVPPAAVRPEGGHGPDGLHRERPGRLPAVPDRVQGQRPEGRPFCRRTTDGGLTWRFLSFIGPEPAGYAIMPSTVRLSPTDLVTTIRRRDPPRSWIDAYASHDDGQTWSFLSTPEPDTGEGNPPSLRPV